MYIVIDICKYFYYFALITLILVLPTIPCGRGTFLFSCKIFKKFNGKMEKRRFCNYYFTLKQFSPHFLSKGVCKQAFRPFWASVLKITQYSLLCNNLPLQTLYGLPYYCQCKGSMCFQRGGCEGADFVEVLAVLFAVFLRHFPSLRFMNMAAMAESVSASTKRKFLALDLTKWVETFCKFSLTQAHSRRFDLVYST